MEDTGVTSLDDVFNSQPEESAPSEQSEQIESQPDDKGVTAEPPAAEQNDPPEVKAFKSKALDETRKRQAAEGRVRELESRQAEAIQQALRQQEAEFRQYLQQVQQQSAPQQTQQGISPEQFNSYEEYLTALADARADARAQAAIQQFAQTQAEQQKQAEIQFRQRQHAEALARATLEDITPMLTAGAEKYADFADVVGNPSVNISDHARDYMAGLDNGHDVVYHLAQNPAEADRIFRLPNSSQSRELAKIAKSVATPAPVVAPPSLPKTLTQTRSAGGQFTNPWTGPTPLDEVFRRPK